MAEKLAIIRNVRFGCVDADDVGLEMTVWVQEHRGATVILYGNDAIEFIKDFGVSDVRQLEGRACWVQDDGTTIGVLRPAKM